MKHGGKASKHQIARELKISLDYINAILGDLRRKGEVAFFDGFYSLISIKKSVTQEEKREKPVAAKLVEKWAGCRTKKLRSAGKKARKPQVGKRGTSSLSGILGISESLARTLEKAGYGTVESLAEAPISRLMDAAKLNLRVAAQLINQARKTK